MTPREKAAEIEAKLFGEPFTTRHRQDAGLWLRAEIERALLDTIEECAKIAEPCPYHAKLDCSCSRVAAEIRKMGEK